MRGTAPHAPGPAGPPDVVGIVLAAGAGTRFGMPKALVRDDDGTPWLELACRALREGGCSDVVVVLGARADKARVLVPADARPVVAAGWSGGVAASLRAGLAEAGRTGAVAAAVTLVDLPGLRPDAVRRVLGTLTEQAARGTLARATYAGDPGHPVLVGRAHWGPLADAVHGDTGAGPYLREHGVRAVDCTDLGGGTDVDHRP
ncbi:NTP transferase domain-containing protein [Promicromonospora sp. NPDC052451]|uniref:nucleotidyltransferase family protein n=1 Tax=Promicromonospora sp. NPDC052451 TaxID=3364407 RepID=UPI0037CA41A8